MLTIFMFYRRFPKIIISFNGLTCNGIIDFQLFGVYNIKAGLHKSARV